MTEHICLELPFAPGDSVVFTAAVRDLCLQHSDRFRVSVRTSGSDVWTHNPRISPHAADMRRVRVRLVDRQRGLHEIRRANRGAAQHFIGAYHRVLSQHLGVPVKLTKPQPELFLRPEETSPVTGRPYWVIFAGWKDDVPLKGWPADYWQTLVDLLNNWGIICVQVGRRNRCVNPPLRGVIDLVGQTSLRQLFTLIRDAEGVICGLTQGAHVAAALDRPCVVLGGGREAWWWEAYANQNPAFAGLPPLAVPHRYLHTLGLLDCCKTSGCWKSAAAVTQRIRKSASLCHHPTAVGSELVGQCMQMITPQHVLNAVLSYYLDGTLPPHGVELERLLTMIPTGLPAIDQPLEFQRQDGVRIQIRADIPDIAPAPPPAPAPEPVPVVPPNNPARDIVVPALAHPIIGGKVTLCVLTYGDYHELHRQCIDSILETTPRDGLELRVGGNQLCPATEQYLTALHERGDVAHLDLSPENRKKYPVMRRLFRDPPLQTEWVIWFDDDTLCNRDPAWLQKMLTIAIENFDSGCRVVGPHYRFTRWDAQWQKWCEVAPWYSGRAWPTSRGRIKPSFPTGSLWLAHVPTVLALDIPDPRIGHNHGDVTIGCQFWQGGWRLCDFSTRRDIVNWSSTARRGITDKHPSQLAGGA